MTLMRVARLHEVGQPLRVEQIDKPAPGPGEVLVKVTACGLIPNAFNVVNGRTPFTLPDLPAVFGLDTSGVIEAVGEKVLGLRAGQRVYVNPHITCDTCAQCRRGREDMCAHGCLRGYMTTTEAGAELINRYPIGGLSEFVVSPARKILVLPDGVDSYTAARFGYIGTSYGGLRKGGLGPGQTLLINGVTGTLGVAAVAIALGLGATKILGIGRNTDIMARLEALAPDRVVTCSSEECDDLPGWVADHVGPDGVDVFYDCLGVGGNGATTDTLMRTVTPGGHAMLAAGGVDADITRSYTDLMAQDISVRAVGWSNAAQFDELAALVGAGVIDFSLLEHRTFALDDVNDAFTVVGDRPGGFTNIVVLPTPRSDK